MPHAMIFDAVRTPRGKGKKDGSLHEVKPIDLLAGLLVKLQKRHGFDPAALDDVVMGVVSPVGEQGSVIAKTAALKAGWDFKVAGMQINRFCASGLEAVNIAAQKVASGWEDLVVAGGVESMSRVPIGSDGGAWSQDPATNFQIGFVPQGIGADLIATLAGWDREDVDRYALASQQRAAAAQSAGRSIARCSPSTTRSACRCSSATNSSSRERRSRASASSRSPSPSSARWGSMRSRSRAIRRSSASSTCTPPATRRGSSTAPPPC
jgi:acetyl-CoA acetyltransferase